MPDNLVFERNGSTWSCEHPAWSVVLTARKIYHGTQREIATLTLTRKVGTRELLIVTSRIDMLIASQIRGFAKEAAERLKGTLETGAEQVVIGIIPMVDAMREHLLAEASTIDLVGASDIPLPDKPAPPKYALWPIIPWSRPGMLVGPSGMGKSTAAQAFGLTVVTGSVILPGVEPRVQGPVFYIGQEEDAEQWAARLEMICKGHRLKRPKDYYYLKLKGGSLIDSAELLAEMAAQRKAVLIIVDSAQATWGGGEDAVREYASHWYNAVESLIVPTLVIEHPNLADTRKNGNVGGFAAGSSVKRDRVGHAWNMKSIALPVQEGEPIRYHVTLTDVKRNYVAKQADITYETVVSGYEYLRFNPAGALTADTVVTRVTDLERRVLAKMRQPSPEDIEFGFTVEQLMAATGQESHSNISKIVRSSYWRDDPKTDYQFNFEKVGGTGMKGDPYRYRLVTRDRDDEGIEMSSPPGDADGWN